MLERSKSVRREPQGVGVKLFVRPDAIGLEFATASTGVDSVVESLITVSERTTTRTVISRTTLDGSRWLSMVLDGAL